MNSSKIWKTAGKKMDEKILTAAKPYPRSDLFLSEALFVSRSAAKKMLDSGSARRGEKILKASDKVNEGDEIAVEIAPPETLDAKPENIPLDIVYEDEWFAVVNKPQGMTVHAGNGNKEGTLVNALLYNLDSLSTINGVVRPGIVHRIDKNTSGLLVVAKCDAAHLSLQRQIQDKTCRRIYTALLEGALRDDEGTVDTYIGRSPTDRVKMAVVPEGKGRRAVTNYRVIKRYEGYTLCEFELKTGRTHQIRVHAKYLGHPVVGDDVYGAKDKKFGLSGQLLHAGKLVLNHPETGERMTFEAPLPDYFEDVLKKLRPV